MNLIATLIVSRHFLKYDPVEGQTKEEFIQSYKEGIMDDPFLFIDSEKVEIAVIVSEIPE